MNERIIDLLYRSLDEKLSQEEQRELREALSSSPELREEKKCLEEMRKAIAENAERSFKPFFSARVLRRIKAEADKRENFLASLVWAFKRVAVAGALALLLLIASSVLVEKSLSLDSVLGMPQLSLEETWQLENPIEEAVQ